MKPCRRTLFLIPLMAVLAVSLFSMDSVKILTQKILRLNSPLFTKEEFADRKYRLYRPKHAGLMEQNQKIYPLVVYLHGAGERGNDNRRQSFDLSFLGNGFDRQAKLFRTQYPCFVYVPQCPEDKNWSDQPTLLATIQTIEHIISTNPIDRDRLYLIGYSMGGSGTYSLAAEYYNLKKQLFAGIIRLAGQGTFPDRTHEIIAQSSIWLHVGLKDIELRVNKAREAYNKLKFYTKANNEHYKKITIPDHPGKTTILEIPANCESVRISEYEQDGHSISHFPFQDPSLMEWLFKLEVCRKPSSP